MEIPDAQYTRKVGKSVEEAAKLKAALEAENRKARIALETEKFVQDNLPPVRAQIAKKLKEAAKTSSGQITHEFGAGLGWREIINIIQKELQDKGYRTYLEYNPEEIGRQAYDEMDIPASYDLHISW